MTPSKCPHCGADRYATEELKRLQKYNQRLEKDYRRLRLEGAGERADFDLRLFRQEESLRYLQSKTARQARIIRQLEERLLKQNQNPYEEK